MTCCVCGRKVRGPFCADCENLYDRWSYGASFVSAIQDIFSPTAVPRGFRHKDSEERKRLIPRAGGVYRKPEKEIWR